MRKKKTTGTISLEAVGDSMYKLSKNQDFNNWMGLLADRWTKLYSQGKEKKTEEYWSRLDELDEVMDLANSLVEKAKAKRKREEDETDFPTKELEGE